RRRHTSFSRDWSSDVCSSDLVDGAALIRPLGADRLRLGVARLGGGRRRGGGAVRVPHILAATLPLDLLAGHDRLVAGAAGGGVAGGDRHGSSVSLRSRPSAHQSTDDERMILGGW